MTSNSRAASVEDRLAVGSSKMSTRASAESARAMATSCRSAGPMSAKSRSSGSENPARSAIAAARRRIEAGETKKPERPSAKRSSSSVSATVRPGAPARSVAWWMATIPAAIASRGEAGA